MCVTHRWPLRNAARDRAALARMRDSTDVPRTTGRETQMLRISGLTSDGQASARPPRRHALPIASAGTIVAVLAAGTAGSRGSIRELQERGRVGSIRIVMRAIAIQPCG